MNFRCEQLEDRRLLNIDFPKFEMSNDLLLVGNASIDDNVLRLSETGMRQGSATAAEKQIVSTSFETKFDFRAEGNGLALVIQNHDAEILGNGTGYTGVPNSLAIDFRGNRIEIHSAGEDRNHQGSVSRLAERVLPDGTTSDGEVHSVVVRYESQRLSIFLDDVENPFLQTSVNIGHLLNLDFGRAWVGFVSAPRSHEILNWTFQSLGNMGTFVGIEDAQILEGNDGTRDVQVTIRREGLEPVSVSWNTADSLAIANEDYLARSGVVSFEADNHETLRTLSIPILGDSNIERFEDFAVRIDLLSGDAAIVDDQARITILNDDTTISIVDGHATEGGSGMQYVRAFENGPMNRIEQARGLVAGPDGNLYITVERGPLPGGVLRYDPTTGRFVDVFASHTKLDGAKDLDFGPDGHLYVVNNRTHRILRFDGSSGEFIDEFVKRGEGGLNVPRDIAFGLDGNLYVSNATTNSILRYQGPFGENPGASMGEFIAAGAGGMRSPTAFAFGPDEKFIYVASGAHDIFNNSILKFDVGTGEYVEAFDISGTTELTLVPTGGLNFGPDLNRDGVPELFASNGDGPDEVLAFDGSTGERLADFIPANLGELYDPKGFVFSDDGRFFIVSNGADQIVEYATDDWAVLTVNIAPLGHSLDVEYSTIAGSALDGIHFQSTAGTLTFQPGESQQTILVRTIDNGFVTDNEKEFSIELNVLAAGIRPERLVGKIVMSDDDVAEPGPGDSNLDGVFNSSDLVRVFQIGKYEDRFANNATFEEGDWNLDGDFTTADFVFAFQAGTYSRASRLIGNGLASAVDTVFTLREDAVPRGRALPSGFAT